MNLSALDPAWILIGLAVAGIASIATFVVVLVRMPQRQAFVALQARIDALSQENERLERRLLDETARHRAESAELARAHRGEQNAQLARLAQALGGQSSRIAQMQNTHLENFAGSTDRRLAELRGAVEARLRDLQVDNAAKLDQMRHTVDEKLQQTLESRLAHSFQQVSERLEQVHRGLGEMQSLAAGVGDLKRVLTNVKVRGTWGEVQLGALLEQVFAPGQYERQVEMRKGASERVDYAIRLPGRDVATDAVWLPIDAKFPQEDYARLVEAAERGDVEAHDTAARQLEARIRLEARSIRDKYIDPPRTTDFAILFLPTEGLYAEVLRRPGLAEAVQQECRVVIAGPTTLAALLNSLQMGFRTLAIEHRSAEVWRMLGSVKAEFGKFGVVLSKTREKLEAATKSLGEAEHRSRQIEKRLTRVEQLPGSEDLADALQKTGTDPIS